MREKSSSLLLFLVMGVIILPLFFLDVGDTNTNTYEEKFKEVKQSETEKHENIVDENSGEQVKVNDFSEGLKESFLLVFKKVAPVAGILILASVIITLLTAISFNLKEMAVTKEATQKSEYRGIRYNKKGTGGKSASKLIDVLKMIETIRNTETLNKGNKGLVLEVEVKLKKVLQVYLADEKAFGMVMYKYEKTFEELFEAFKKALNIGLLNDYETLNKINEIVNYPYEEIVIQQGKKWATGDLDKENYILDGLKKSKETE